MSKDLRQFLRMAREAGADYYAEVRKPLDIDLEVNVLQEKLAKEGRYPVIYCPQMKGSKLPLCTNLFGSYEMLGLALDIDPDTLKRLGKAEIQQEYMRRLNDPKPVQWVSTREAPVKDIIIKGGDVDLGILPIPKGSELDSGKYIGIGGCITKFPDTGILNMGVYRHEVKDRNKLGCYIGPTHHGAYVARQHADMGKTMEVVIYIGHHPAVSFAAVTSSRLLEEDELQHAGGFLGEPLRVTRGETVDLPVPADAEIIIEGIIDPSKMVTDGPYAEFTYYYGGKRPCYLIDVTCITMRKDAIFHHIDSAHCEHNLSMVLSGECSVYEVVKRRIPTVKAVHCPAHTCRHHFYVSLAKRAQGEGMLAGLLALGAEDRGKLVIVVDEDVDVFDEEEVLWALATRVSWDKDIAVIPRIATGPLDPRNYSESVIDYETGEVGKGEMIGKIRIDATKPVTMPYATRIIPPEDLWKSMKLEDYLK